MFNAKKDRGVVEVVIEFNLSAISKWLDEGGKIEDIEKIAKDWGVDDVRLSYYIDVLPNGQMSDMYFHRKKGLVSNVFGGVDYLRNIDDNLKIFLKNTKIKVLEWNSIPNFLSLSINEDEKQKTILLAPLEEIIDLQINRHLKNGKLDLFGEDQKIKAPISFDENNQPKEYIDVWRRSKTATAVGYHNALGSVSASGAFFDTVEY